MGSGHSSVEERERSKEIDRYLRKERGSSVDILLLGQPQSGKSLIAKRIKHFAAKGDDKDSLQDALRTYTPTSEIQETKFSVDGSSFRLIDLRGGTESKALQCFETCHVILFVVSLTEAYEENGEGGYQTSIEYLKRIRKSPLFSKANFTLLLTKRDLFEAKVKERDLSDVLPSAPHSLSPADAVKFVADLFLAEINGNQKAEKEKESASGWTAMDLTNLEDQWEENFLFPLFRSGKYFSDLTIPAE
jgi:hypothetical protein